MVFGLTILAIFLSSVGTRFYKHQFEKNDDNLTLVQKKVFERMDDLAKNQEKLQSDLRDLIEKLKQNS